MTLIEAKAEIEAAILSVSRRLAPRFTFGCHTKQDIEQQGCLLALKGLESGKYDVTRCIEKFLYAHVRNRLKNFKRDEFMRVEAPCQCCEPFDPPPEPCKRWWDWHTRNTSKRNLMRPLDVSVVSDDGESGMRSESTIESDAQLNEMLSTIDACLPIDLRADYLRMRAGVAVPKARRQRVREAVLEILT